MNVNSTQNLSFQKTLRGTGGIKNKHRTEKVKLYKLDKPEDIKELYKVSKDEMWRDNVLLDDVLLDIEDYFQYCDIYTMENKKGEIISYSIVASDRNAVELEYIETAPIFSSKNSKKRPIKCVGETMVSFLATLYKNQDITVPCVVQNDGVLDFYYNNCRFDKDGSVSAKLKKENSHKLAITNMIHTGKGVKIIN